MLSSTSLKPLRLSRISAVLGSRPSLGSGGMRGAIGSSWTRACSVVQGSAPKSEAHLGEHSGRRCSDQRRRGLRRLPDHVMQERAEIGCRIDSFEGQIYDDVVRVAGWLEHRSLPDARGLACGCESLKCLEPRIQIADLMLDVQNGHAPA